MAEDTIPRPIRYKFLAVAQEVCELAKVDYWEQTEVLSSLREQMEISYRAYDQAGLYKDDAEAQALKDFGSSERVARVHRGGVRGLWQRLLFNQRYSVHRTAAPVLFCMLHLWLKSTGSLQVTVHLNGTLGLKYLLFGWDFYIGAMVLGLVGITRAATRYWPRGKYIIEIATVSVTIFLFGKLAIEWSNSVREWFRIWGQPEDGVYWRPILGTSLDLVGYIVEAVAFVFVLTLALAEILNVPVCHRAVIEAKRKRRLANAGFWSLWLDNGFRFLIGQRHKLVWKIVR